MARQAAQKMNDLLRERKWPAEAADEGRKTEDESVLGETP
jgi:hypothetical protein